MHYASRQYRIFRVTHNATGHYYLSMTLSREYSLNSFIERLNEQYAWKPDRKYANAALMWFIRKFGPFTNNDFTVVQEKETFRNRYQVIDHAGHIARKLGSDKLLTTRVVKRQEWQLYEKALIELSPRGKLAVQPPRLSKLEQMGAVELESQPMHGGMHLWQLLGLVPTSHCSPVVLTKLAEEQFSRCISAGHVVMAYLKVKLAFKIDEGWKAEVRESTVTLVHFAPTIASALKELEEMATSFVHEHTPESKYDYYGSK